VLAFRVHAMSEIALEVPGYDSSPKPLFTHGILCKFSEQFCSNLDYNSLDLHR
jgi:hypothetical protein